MFLSIASAAGNPKPSDREGFSPVGTRVSRLAEPAEPLRVSSRLPRPADTSRGDESYESYGASTVIIMVPAHNTEPPRAAMSTTTPGLDPSEAMTCDNIDGSVAEEEYAGVEWSRPSLKGRFDDCATTPSCNQHARLLKTIFSIAFRTWPCLILYCSYCHRKLPSPQVSLMS